MPVMIKVCVHVSVMGVFSCCQALTGDRRGHLQGYSLLFAGPVASSECYLALTIHGMATKVCGTFNVVSADWHCMRAMRYPLLYNLHMHTLT